VECYFYASSSGLGDGDGTLFLSFFFFFFFFSARLYSISIQHGEDDRLIWNLSKMGLFEVKSYY
jgi:hypothetical protein